MEKNDFKEIKQHGTTYFPFAFYENKSDSEGLIVKHHWHDQLELVYMKQGKFEVEVDMDNYNISNECFCFINSGELHFIKSKYPFNESAIVFDLNMISFERFDSIQGELIQPLLNGQLKIKRFIFKNENFWDEIFNEYKEISDSYKKGLLSYENKKYNIFDNIVLQMRIKSSILKILAILKENDLLIKENNNSKDYRIEYLKKTISYIQENYKEKLYIKDLAEQINMNEQYFCRFFKKMIGKTPIEYLNEYRIKKAKELLSETSIQVMDICLDCGFYNMGNFIKVFKKYTEMSPIKYRKTYNKKS